MNDFPKTSLLGLRVGILQSRDVHHLSKQLKIRGAHVISAPVLSEQPTDCSLEIAHLIDALTAKNIHVCVLQTGVGVDALFKKAALLGREEELRDGLNHSICVARGPKPVGALRKRGVTNCRQIASPYTTYELIDSLCDIELADSNVAVIHYGERNEKLTGLLATISNTVFELFVYRWELPENLDPISRLIDEVLGGKVDVIAFTSQIQVRHLMAIADQLGVKHDLTNAIQNTTVAAIGPTCATALRRMGVTPDIVPEHPKMGHMVREISKRFALAPA